jgi:hypothetical protein
VLHNVALGHSRVLVNECKDCHPVVQSQVFMLFLDHPCRSFQCILWNRNLGLSLVGFGLFSRLLSRLLGHFVKLRVTYEAKHDINPLRTILFLEVAIILIYCDSGHDQIADWVIFHNRQHKCSGLMMCIAAVRATLL